jgi:protein-L-isoaspartate(D-aspartate) O-methyltransferase
MLTIPREAFVPDDWIEAAYADDQIEFAPRRAILEPRSQAKLLDALDIQPDEMVLSIGCGLGYSAAIAAHLAEAVVAVEDDDARVEDAQRRLSENGVDNAAVVSAELAEGAPKHGPYDAIFIEGAVEELPQAIISQLKDGGRIAAIFQQGALGTARIGVKRGDSVSWRFAFNAQAPVLAGYEKLREFSL